MDGSQEARHAGAGTEENSAVSSSTSAASATGPQRAAAATVGVGASASDQATAVPAQRRRTGQSLAQTQRVVAAGATQDVPRARWTMLQLLLWTFASMLHTFVGFFGLMFTAHAAQAGAMLRSAGMFQDFGSVRDAATLLLGNFALPFSESVALAASAVSPDSLGFEVYSFWLPGMMGSLLFLTGACAHLALRYRRLIYVLPYSLLAVVFLVWQVELSKMLYKFAHHEEFELKQDRLSKHQAVQFHMFNMTYDGFTTIYDEQHCTTTLPTVNSGAYEVRVDCSGDTIEGNLIKAATMQLCRAVSPIATTIGDYDRRVQLCLNQGRRLQILPQALQPRDTVFCRCRSALYDWLRLLSQWLSVFWFVELAAACTVLYFGVETNLARMDATARREILGFAAFGLVGLMLRVTVFADKPLDERLAEL